MIVVYATCPSCDWKSHLHDGGVSGRMMGVLTGSNAAEDELHEHFLAKHYRRREPAEEAVADA